MRSWRWYSQRSRGIGDLLLEEREGEEALQHSSIPICYRANSSTRKGGGGDRPRSGEGELEKLSTREGSKRKKNSSRSSLTSTILMGETSRAKMERRQLKQKGELESEKRLVSEVKGKLVGEVMYRTFSYPKREGQEKEETFEKRTSHSRSLRSSQVCPCYRSRFGEKEEK